MYAVKRMSAWSLADEKLHAFGDIYNAISLRLIRMSNYLFSILAETSAIAVAVLPRF
jgi:hypothetical protein